MLLTVSLWHKDAYNRFFLCMEATYHAITTQRMALVGGILLALMCVVMAQTLAPA